MSSKDAAKPMIEAALDAIGRAQSLIEEARWTLARLGSFRKEQGEARRTYDHVSRLFYAVARARDAATGGLGSAGSRADSTGEARDPGLERG
jgi:hypothetical protein